MNLFIDIDGVLLGKSPDTKRPCLAHSAEDFLRFCLNTFDCYWLTTHCKGDASTAINYLRPYADEKFIALAKKIKPTSFKTFKTEALFGDFFWIDDQPTAYEIQYLDENDWLQYWIQVNTRKDINELSSALRFLKSAVKN